MQVPGERKDPDLVILSPTHSNKALQAIQLFSEQVGRGAANGASVSHRHVFD